MVLNRGQFRPINCLSSGMLQEKISVKEIEVPNDVVHPMLGLPNPTSSQCLTCDAKDVKTCEGHFGFINFPYTILHPYLISDVAKILNKFCVECKAERSRAKVRSGYISVVQ